MIKAVINVPAPRAAVFQVLSDFRRYKEWVPGCESCTVDSENGNSTETTITITSMKRIQLGLRFDAQPDTALAFKMIKGKDLKSYAGTYRLMDASDGNGTVVIAELEIDVGMMAPKFMVDKITRKMMDDTGVAIRAHIQRMGIKAGPASAKPAAATKPPRRHRARRLLRVTKTNAGYNVWLLGETHDVKSNGT
jgi:carbon monoxide dehydrogenase subunit G